MKLFNKFKYLFLLTFICINIFHVDSVNAQSRITQSEIEVVQEDSKSFTSKYIEYDRKTAIKMETKSNQPSDKDWTVKFNRAIKKGGYLNSNIFVVDENNYTQQIYIEAGTDPVSIKVTPPSTGYSSGHKYTLIIKDVRDKNDRPLGNTTIMDFDIESNHDKDEDDYISYMELEVLRLVNIERVNEGLSPLKWDFKLGQVARIKSEDMAYNGYFSHTSPTYGSPFDMMKMFGIRYRTAGENIAGGYTTAQQVVDGWMNSPGHRANILSPHFGKIGVGYAEASRSTRWTQMFTD